MFRCYLYSDKTTQEDRYNSALHSSESVSYTRATLYYNTPQNANRAPSRLLPKSHRDEADKEPYKPSRRSRCGKGERSFLQSSVKTIEKSVYTREIPERSLNESLNATIARIRTTLGFPSQLFVPLSRHGLYPRSPRPLSVSLSLSFFLLPPSTVPPPPPFFSPRRLVLLLPLMPGLTAKTTERALSYGARCDAAI